MNTLILLTLLFNSLQFIGNQLIKSNDVYKNVIKNIYEYYQCDSVVLFYAPSSFLGLGDVESKTKLKNLIISFNKNSIQATVVNIEELFVRDNQILQQLSKNFFVFLDDSDKLKIQLMKQLTPLIDISAPVWLIFFSNSTEIKDYFTDFYIPFNCRFMISQKNSRSSDNSEIITEIYQISKYTELNYNIFGSWSPDYGFQLPTASLYRRRSDLSGHSMRIAALDSTPGSIIRMDKQRGMRIGGIFGTIVDILQERMNFTPAYHVVSEYGSRLENGTWTGGVGSLVYNICDIFPTNLRMVYARLEAIQFTAPLYLTRDCFFFKKPLSTLSWNLFLTPFNESIWIIIPFLIIATSIIISLMLLFYKRKKFLTLVETNASRISNVFLDVFGAFCGQGMPKSTIASINVVQFTIHMTALIILAAYSGILTSSLTIDTFVAPFATMEGFMKDGSYKMGVLGNSAFYDIFQNAADELTKEIFEKKILTETSLPQTFIEGLERVCTEQNYAFLSSDIPAARFRRKNCILLASEAVFVSSLAIGLPQNSPYRGLIDHHIFIMRDSGILQKIFDDWTNTPPTKAENEAKTVEFFNILPLVTLLIFDGLLSILFLWGERVMYRKFLKRKENEMWKKLNIKIYRY